MNPAVAHNIGAMLKPVACQAVSITAGGAGDGTEATGQWIDRQGYLSALLVITYKTTLAADKTLTISAALDDATTSGGAGSAAYGPSLSPTVVATGAVTNLLGTVKLPVDLAGARRYIRARFTPDLSATSTDTAIVSATLVLGGAGEVPVT